MNTMDNAKVIETLEKVTIKNYLEKLISSRLNRITLYPVFPITAAPNYSEQRNYVLVADLNSLLNLNSGCYNN